MENNTNKKPLNIQQKELIIVKYNNMWTGLISYI